MTPATAFILILVISFIVSAAAQISIPARSRKNPGQGRKHGKQWEREKTAEQAIITDAENAYFAASHYATPRYALLSGDELHQWIVLRCDNNPYGIEHAWKDCPTCIPQGPPKISVKKTPKSVSEKTQGPFAENGSEKNGPAKSYKNGGPVSGKTPIFVADRDLDEIVRAKAEEKSQPKWAEVLGEELTREALRQHFEKNPDALPGIRPEKKPEYAKTHTFDQLVDKKCRRETLHTAHTWVPKALVATYCRCPGVQDFDPKPKVKAGPPRWCRGATVHPEHLWSQDGEDITCLGTFQTFTWMEHDRLVKELGAGGGARQPSVAPAPWMAQAEVLDTPVTSYVRCPQPVPHLAHRWTQDWGRFCDGLDQTVIPADAVAAGYSDRSPCVQARAGGVRVVHAPHPFVSRAGNKWWCAGWSGPDTAEL